MAVNRSTPVTAPVTDSSGQGRVADASDSDTGELSLFSQLLPGVQDLAVAPAGLLSGDEAPAEAPADEAAAQIPAVQAPVAEPVVPLLPVMVAAVDASNTQSLPRGATPLMDAIFAAKLPVATNLPVAGMLPQTTLAAPVQPLPAAAEPEFASTPVAAEPNTKLSLVTDAQPLPQSEEPRQLLPENRMLSSALLSLGAALPREVQQGAAAPVEWAPLPVVPQAEGGKPQALQQLLAERLAVQSSHGMDRALIRLDPPRFGALEIALQHEGGRLTVQLTASHGEVVRQLQGIGDFLRQELGQRQFQSVQVDIRHGMQDSQQQGGRQQQQGSSTPGRALQLDDEAGFAASYASEEQQA